MKPTIILAALLGAGAASAAAAQSNGPPAKSDTSPQDIIDVESPAAMVEALREGGYRAQLKTASDGSPLIESSTGGDGFSIRFYDCREERCGSFEFYSWWKKKPYMNVELANAWNAKKRFLRAYIDSDGDLSVSIDVTGTGKMSRETFLDWVDWWELMTGEMDQFLVERDPGSKAK